MILWHMGLATLITYVTLGRRRIDYRFILVGAILPDLLDGIVGPLFFEGPSGRWIAHSLLAVIVMAVAIILLTRAERRLSLFGLAVGWLLHLVGDGMWQAAFTFFWPAFGNKFNAAPAEPYSWDLFTHPLDHLSTWGAEAAGLAVLAWFWIAFRLSQEGRLRLFLKDGYLRP